MLLNGGLNTPRTGHLHNGRPLSKERGHVIETCDDVAESQMRYAKGKKPDSERSILSDSMYTASRKGKAIERE